MQHPTRAGRSGFSQGKTMHVNALAALTIACNDRHWERRGIAATRTNLRIIG